MVGAKNVDPDVHRLLRDDTPSGGRRQRLIYHLCLAGKPSGARFIGLPRGPLAMGGV
jgi:hypothetical protein